MEELRMIEVHGNARDVSVVSNTYYIQDSYNSTEVKNDSGGCAIAGMVGFLVLVGGAVTIIVTIIGMIVEVLT
jgi:hypothetical protein